MIKRVLFLTMVPDVARGFLHFLFLPKRKTLFEFVLFVQTCQDKQKRFLFKS
jgi:hypothetical protein